MSSTSIVVKCLTDTKATSSPHGQITIGTLILQVRAALVQSSWQPCTLQDLACALRMLQALHASLCLVRTLLACNWLDN